MSLSIGMLDAVESIQTNSKHGISFIYVLYI